MIQKFVQLFAKSSQSSTHASYFVNVHLIYVTRNESLFDKYVIAVFCILKEHI